MNQAMTTPEQQAELSKNMIPVRDLAGVRYGILYAPGHPKSGWIFCQKDGAWVEHRMGFAHEIDRAARIFEERNRDVPQKG